MTIGDNIKRLRASKNLTQAELAEKVSVTQPMIAQLERNTKALTVQLCKELATALDCKIDELLAE